MLAETGFYYLNSRYYDPEIGRFVNADSVISGTGESIQGYNLYSYCNNNPINLEDSTGTIPKFLRKIFSRVKHSVKIMIKIAKSPFKALKVRVGAGPGIGLKASARVKGLKIEVAAATSITDSVTYENNKFDFTTTTSSSIGVEIEGIIEKTYTKSKWHSFADEKCICDAWRDSFSKRSECPANINTQGVDTTIGISFGAYFIFGAEVSIGVDVKSWGDELISILHESLSYVE